MLESWTIVPAPTPKDPNRHTLLVKGQMADVQGLIRRIGAACGRPQKERGRPEFNYSMALRGVTASELSRIQAMLGALATERSREEVPPPSAVGARPETAGLMDLSSPEPRPSPVPEPSRAPAAPTPAAVIAAFEPFPHNPSLAPAGPAPLGDEIGPAGGFGGPRVVAGLAPTAAPSAAAVPAGLWPAGAAAPPAATAAPVPGPDAPSVSGPIPDAPRPVSPAGRVEKPLWGAAMPLDSGLTFDSLAVGPFNRFSHAASMAVVSSPGTMYNPLFLFGNPGVGKTHLLTAIGRAFAETNPNDGIFFTSGPRLARAVRRAKSENRMPELEGFIKKTKALMVDDFHLISVSEQNQDGLAAVFNHYFQAAKQVVLTSAYPPRALGALEDALKFQISSGWSVDMKALNADAQKEAVRLALGRIGFDADVGPATFIQESIANTFSEMSRWLERLRCLGRLREKANQPANSQTLLSLLMVPDLPPGAAAPNEEIQGLLAGMPPPPAGGPGARNLAVFFPTGREPHGRYMVQQFHQSAARNGWSFPLKQTVSQAYDPEQLYGIPFTIGEACDRGGIGCALILGPNAGSGLGAREGDFVHAVGHILSSLDIRLGYIPFLRIKEPLPYFRACLDACVPTPTP